MIARGTKHNQAIKLILLGSLVAKKRFDSTTVSGWLTVLLCAIPAMHNVLYGIAYGWREPFTCFLSICSTVLIIHAFFYCNPELYGTTWVINPVLPAMVCLARPYCPPGWGLLVPSPWYGPLPYHLCFTPKTTQTIVTQKRRKLS